MATPQEASKGKPSGFDSQINLARKYFGQEKIYRTPDIPRAIVNAVSARIEEGKSSDDPQAYVLRRVTIDPLGADATYFIIPPKERIKQTGIQMLTFRKGEGFVSNTDLNLFYEEDGDLNNQGTKKVGRHAVLMAFDVEKESKLLEDMLQSFADIQSHGIKLSPDLIKVDPFNKKDVLSEEYLGYLETFLDKHPFTNQVAGEFRIKAVKATKDKMDAVKAEEDLEKRVRLGYWQRLEAGNIPYLSEDEQEVAKFPPNVGEYRQFLEQTITKMGARRISFQSSEIPNRMEVGTRGVARQNYATGEVDYLPEDTKKGRFTEVVPYAIEAGTTITATEPNKNTQIEFSPKAALDIRERMSGGGEETYRIYLTDSKVNPGIVLHCPASGKSSYVNFKQINMLPVGIRKPVIYLYPKRKVKVSVKLKFNGQLINVYPKLKNNMWNITALPTGIIIADEKKYRYLFWDGLPSREIEWDWSTGFSVHRNEVDLFLEEKITKLGLNSVEAQDFITYWAPMMKQNEWSLVSFQREKYEELAKLTIDPKPDMLIRIFMVFKKINTKIEIPKQKIKKMSRKGFVVVEWGGSNLDEMQLSKNVVKTNSEKILAIKDINYAPHSYM